MPTAAIAEEKVKLYCPHCRKTRAENYFYKMPNGKKSDMCKECETLHIDNWDPETIKPLCKKYDIPWVEAEWNVLRDRYYNADPLKFNNMSVFGRYLAKMKINQWKNYHWADTERLAAEAAEKVAAYNESGNGGLQNALTPEKIAEIQEKYNRGEISEEEYTMYANMNAPSAPPIYQTMYPTDPTKEKEKAGPASYYPANEHPFEEVELEDVGASLTKEDKIYLAMKWGRLYTAEDWVQLEKLYNDFFDSFPIETAAHIDQLKFICKTSLKANQALDAGDFDTYKKLMSVYDAQMKAGKFTEAQKKDEKADAFTSVSSLVEFAEKEGGKIPRYKIEYPLDIADQILMKNKNYISSIVENDPTLAQQIEQYLKRLELAESLKEARANGEDPSQISDQDLIDYHEMLQEEAYLDTTEGQEDF